jgi:AcrR family transcriptional regulator
VSSSDDLREIALREFTFAGFSATSLQHIAELAGLSKSSVLYHFASKEALLEAAVSPAVDRLESIVREFASDGLAPDRLQNFIENFVDFLLQHRRELHIFINQGPTLEDVPVIERANQLVLRLTGFFMSSLSSAEDRMRFGIALGGAAYMLVAQEKFTLETAPIDETRAALVAIMSEVLHPVSVRSHAF